MATEFSVLCCFGYAARLKQEKKVSDENEPILVTTSERGPDGRASLRWLVRNEDNSGH